MNQMMHGSLRVIHGNRRRGKVRKGIFLTQKSYQTHTCRLFPAVNSLLLISVPGCTSVTALFLYTTIRLILHISPEWSWLFPPMMLSEDRCLVHEHNSFLEVLLWWTWPASWWGLTARIASLTIVWELSLAWFPHFWYFAQLIFAGGEDVSGRCVDWRRGRAW